MLSLDMPTVECYHKAQSYCMTFSESTQLHLKVTTSNNHYQKEHIQHLQTNVVRSVNIHRKLHQLYTLSLHPLTYAFSYLHTLLFVPDPTTKISKPVEKT